MILAILSGFARFNRYNGVILEMQEAMMLTTITLTYLAAAGLFYLVTAVAAPRFEETEALSTGSRARAA